MSRLNVFVRTSLVGYLDWDTKILSFKYNSDYVNQKGSVPISVSLPFHQALASKDVESFFSGLLPDESLRKKLSAYLHVSETNTFGLLKEMGAECAGAISVLPEGEAPHSPHKAEYKELSEDKSYDLLNDLHRIPLGVDFDGYFRISGSGAQDKLMAHVENNRVYIPINGTPSTHIIKPQIKDYPNSHLDEYFCMTLAKRLGLNVPNISLLSIKDQTFFVTERYDRKMDKAGNIIRLHQEDFCQAMGYNPKIKYENEGGPTIQDCFYCIKEHSALAGRDSMQFLTILLFNFLIGNGDAHGKNYSFLYDENRIILAPFYDLMSTIALQPYARKEKMAMRIDGEYLFNYIFMRKFYALADLLGIKKDIFAQILKEELCNIIDVASKLRKELESDPRYASPIYADIEKIITDHWKQLQD